MGGLFGGGAEKPKEPRVVRMPVEDDPEQLAAAERTKRAALERKGRLSTILTDQTRQTTGAASGNSTIGSSGKALGA
jgi:hypothetical protein